MSEPKSVIHAMPQPARYGLFAALLLAIGLASYTGAPMAAWALLGPILLVQMGMGQRFGLWSRAEYPAVFWIGCFLALFLTGVGVVTTYQHWIGATP